MSTSRRGWSFKSLQLYSNSKVYFQLIQFFTQVPWLSGSQSWWDKTPSSSQTLKSSSLSAGLRTRRKSTHSQSGISAMGLGCASESGLLSLRYRSQSLSFCRTSQLSGLPVMTWKLSLTWSTHLRSLLYSDSPISINNHYEWVFFFSWPFVRSDFLTSSLYFPSYNVWRKLSITISAFLNMKMPCSFILIDQFAKILNISLESCL